MLEFEDAHMDKKKPMNGNQTIISILVFELRVSVQVLPSSHTHPIHYVILIPSP
jgi:hypothetical protein